MSPSKFQDAEISKAAIFNPRSSSMRINKDSHAIQNPCGRSSAQKNQNPSGKRHPVIIYTHSPRVIHANAHDFMNLVQKLTGMERSKDEKSATPNLDSNTKDKYDVYSLIKDEGSMSVDDFKSVVGYKENESSSILSSGLTDEKYVDEVKSEDSISSVPPMFELLTKFNPYRTMDGPILDPNSSEFICSSRSNLFLKYPNSGDSILPSSYRNGFSGY